LCRDRKRSKNFHFYKIKLEIIIRIIKNISQRYLTKKQSIQKRDRVRKQI